MELRENKDMALKKSVNGITVEMTVEEEKEFKASLPSNSEIEARKLELLRDMRDGMLETSDWVVIKEREEGGTVSNFAAWKEYRQKLRDITNTYKSLEDVKWPTAPSE